MICDKWICIRLLILQAYLNAFEFTIPDGFYNFKYNLHWIYGACLPVLGARSAYLSVEDLGGKGTWALSWYF